MGSTVLQLVQGNPFRRIQNSITMLIVMKNGKRYCLFFPFYLLWRRIQVYIILMQEDPGERLSDSEEEDKTKNEHDSMIDVEEETDNSFVVPNDYLSEDEVYLS